MEWKKISNTHFTLRLKLFLLLSMLILSILFSVLAILMISGTFTAGLKEAERNMDGELTRFQQRLTEQTGQVSAYTVEFSRELSKGLEKELVLLGLTTAELASNPEILEALVNNEYERCLFSLQKARVSGAFFLLDATVNPALINAGDSRAGLYIKNMEPNILSSSSEYILLLRGFPAIGRNNDITLHPQWRMEFNVFDADYYRKPVHAAKNTELPLSRLFYWSRAMSLPGSTEQVMLCSAPLIDSDGNVFGVCGFEISSMLFKLSHMPEGAISQKATCILAPSSKQNLSLSGALMSGGYSIRDFLDPEQYLTIREGKPFNSYQQQNGTLFSGFHDPFSIYPSGSAFENETWAAALILPDEDISASAVLLNLRLLILFLGLLVIGITLSYFVSRKFLKPLTRGVEIIKSNNYVSRTNVPEIDDLIDFLSTSRENRDSKDKKTPGTGDLPESIFDEFVRNTKRLSPAEKAVFDLYVEGYTAKEITNILYLSINTIKTHNKRIYMKLNVASREELLVYVNMLKEAGKEVL